MKKQSGSIDITEIYFAELRRARDEALLSMDLDKIRKYTDAYGVVLPANEHDMWTGLHIARIQANLTPEATAESIAWLKAQGYEFDIVPGGKR